MDRSSLIDKLALTLHLNMPERTTLGLPVRRSEIESAVLRLLRESGHFPPNARPWREGENVFEGHFLELLPNGGVRLWWQRHFATDPHELAQQIHSDFSDAHAAVKAFVAREWARGIDGIQLMD
jgi:hypothetical protein